MMLFSNNHIWFEQNGDTARLGVSDYAQNEFGDAMFLNLPDLGDTLSIGDRFGNIESLKTVSDLISPVNGIVTAINEPLADGPDAINADPHGSWLIEVSVREVSGGLMDEREYREFVEKIR